MRLRKRTQEDHCALYYASDVHGSTACWRKFLGAGRFYGVQSLIMGGDLTGKAIVPVVRDQSGMFSYTLMREQRTGTTGAQLDEALSVIRYNGMYPWVTTAEEVERVSRDAAAQDELFLELLIGELGNWIRLADERLSEYGIAAYVMAGNDDPWECDDVLRAGSHVQFCDDQVTQVGGHEMISLSYANRTPWDSPRELDEDALYARFKRLAQQLEHPRTAIFNLHVPPFDSGLDRAVEINPEDLTAVYNDGAPHEIPVGSRAVREILEEYQPMLSLHGHIHESRGAAKIGTTLALNSGSEYNTGRIHGVVVKLADDRVVSHQFTIG